MTLSLWPHQTAALAATHDAIATGRQAGLWALPTGTGKTYTFLTLARERGVPTLVLVHRDELIRQAVRSAAVVDPAATVGVLHGEQNAWQGCDIVVASVPSLHPTRLAAIPRQQFGLLIADECHHVPAPSWSRILEHFTPGFLLGVTATPDRLDGQGLAAWFGPEPLFVYALRQAIADGILVPVRQLAIRTPIDLDAIPVHGGDFAIAALGRAVAPAARDQAVVEAYRAQATGRKALAFAVDRAHVSRLAAAFRAAGVIAAVVTGDLPLEERRQVLADFAAGRTAVLVNCAICTEGYDERSIDCVIMARPTQSRALYQQCVGRGLRICPERQKRDCLVLDITDNCRTHKLVTAIDLFGTPASAPASTAEQTESPPKVPRATDVNLAPAVGPVLWSCQEASPWPTLPSLARYAPTAWWHSHPATDKQLAALRQFGLQPVRPLTKGEASYLLRQRTAGAADLPATAKQERYLRDLGAWEPGLTRREVTRRIDGITGRRGYGRDGRR